MNKPIHELSILDINEIPMIDIWYDYTRLKYGGKAKLQYKDKDSYIVYIKTKDIYLGFAIMQK